MYIVFRKPVCKEALVGSGFMIIEFFTYEKWGNLQQLLQTDNPTHQLNNIHICK